MPIRKTLFVVKEHTGNYKSLGNKSLVNEFEKLKPGAYKVIIEEKLNIRSPEQNNWYWALLKFLEENTSNGYSSDEWHETFKAAFLTETKFVPDTDFSYIVTKSTTELDKYEFTVYMEKIITFCESYLNIPRKELVPKVTTGEW